MGKYTKADAAADTKVSIKEASSAWHAAKDHAQKSGELNERLEAKIDQGHKDLARDAFKSESGSKK